MADTPDDNAQTAGDGDGEVDPELIALAEERERGSALQPILFVSVIILGSWIVQDFRDDIEYFFASADPVELGAVDEMSDQDVAELPHNRYVEIGGIPKRRSEGKDYRYFRFVGAPIYAAVPRENPDETLEERVEDEPKGSIDRTYFDGKGRLVAFRELPSRYSGLKEYYRKKYGTRFCERLEESQQERMRKRRRRLIVDNWQKRYEEASPEERREKGLSRKPTESELADILDERSICTQAYLFRAGVAPGDHWWYLLIAGLFGGFVLVNVYWLGRWVLTFFGVGVDVDDLERG